GQIVDAGMPVLVFGSESAGYVLTVPLTDRLAAGRRIGEAATVTIGALDDAEIPARLKEISGRADPATGTFAAEFELEARDGLRSGQIGRVTLSAPQGKPAVTIPASAIFAARAGEALVWTYDPESETVATRSIVPGPLTNGGVRVEAGLRGSERIVIAGLDNLQQGMKVRLRQTANRQSAAKE
ncbi:MAG: HlyD family efflux transporter periplasmic adaptor subunit, partial [Pacificimonas sp.]